MTTNPDPDPGHAPPASETLRAALERIRDAYSHECQCEHDTADCCAVIGLNDFVNECAFCIASVALRAEPPPAPLADLHRCTSCGYRWEGSAGAELCGSCYRAAMARKGETPPAPTAVVPPRKCRFCNGSESEVAGFACSGNEGRLHSFVNREAEREAASPPPSKCRLCEKAQPCPEHSRTPITPADFDELSQFVAVEHEADGYFASPERYSEYLKEREAAGKPVYVSQELLKAVNAMACELSEIDEAIELPSDVSDEEAQRLRLEAVKRGAALTSPSSSPKEPQ